MKKTLLVATLLAASTMLWADEVVMEKNGVTLTDKEILTMTDDLSVQELVAIHQKPDMLRVLIEQLFDNKVMAADLADELKGDAKFQTIKKFGMEKFANRYYIRKKALEKINAIEDFRTLAEQTYQADIKKYSKDPTADYYHILFIKSNNVDSKEQAQQVMAKIKDGSLTLAEAAKQNWNAVSGGNEDGILLKINYKSLMEPIQKAVIGMKEGDVSDVVETEIGYHIISLIKNNDAETVPYSKVEEKIVKDIKTEIYQTVATEIRGKYTGPEGLTVNDALLNEIKEKVIGNKE